MIKTKKQMFIVVGAFALILLLGTASYAFFNYTRTGASNTLGTGRIYFNTDQGNDTLTLTNVFPMTAAQAANANLDTVSVHIQGDTTYFGGEEYQITLVDVVNTANNKTIPIKYNATYTATTNKTVGTAKTDVSYFADRGSSTTMYNLISTGEVEEGKQVLAGYVAQNEAIDGTLTISAYLDSSKVIISDTEEGAGVTVSGYTNGTPSSYIGDAVVLTTSEWNTLTGVNTLSFKIKAEANEGTWVPEPAYITIGNVSSLREVAGAKRYVGGDTSTNNYVYFNGTEKWRIIGVYGDKLKIMKYENHLNLTYNQYSATATNKWDGSTIATYLNGTYYNGLTSNARDMIGTGIWNVGASTASATAVDSYASAQTLTWRGKVGLIAAYEYLYSTNDTSCYTISGASDSYGTSCGLRTNNWVWNGANQYFTMTGSSSEYNKVLCFDNVGVREGFFVYRTANALPVVYLKSSVSIIDGNGTIDTPYVLSYSAS